MLLFLSLSFITGIGIGLLLGFFLFKSYDFKAFQDNLDKLTQQRLEKLEKEAQELEEGFDF